MKFSVSRNLLTAVLGFGLSISATSARAADPHAGHAMPAAAGKQASVEQSEGTVKKIDAAAGKVTIAHGPLKSLGMPPMTMVFKVKDAAQLKGIKEGDAIRFTAEMSGQDYVASKLQVKK